MNEQHVCVKQDIIDSIVKKVDNLDGLREVITEIKTLMSVQVELNRKTDERLEKYDSNMQKHSEALILVTSTMDRQNKSLDKLNEKMDKTKEDLNKKIDEVEKKLEENKTEESNNKTQIKVSKINSRAVIITTWIGGGLTIIGGIVVALIALL